MLCGISNQIHTQSYKHIKTYHHQQVNLLFSEFDDVDEDIHHYFKNTEIYFFCHICDKKKYDEENRKYCNNCKTYITTEYCTSCGLKSTIKDHCQFCNNTSTTKFCGNCGKKKILIKSQISQIYL